MMKGSLSLLLSSCLLLAQCVRAFYLPGVAPKDYHTKDSIALNVNALTSGDSKSLLPYDYYFEKFHFCKPDVLESQRESLGSILFGDRLYNSPFDVSLN
jgi:transmembrane 9 superfamily protein 2/4